MSQYCSKRNGKEIIYDQSNTCDYYEPLENAPSWVDKPKSVHHSASDIAHDQNMNTPRTDAHQMIDGMAHDHLWRSFAETLERELNAAREEITILKSKYADHHAEAERLTSEIRSVAKQRDRLAETVIRFSQGTCSIHFLLDLAVAATKSNTND